MKTPEISLIIPIYNCEKVLPKSLGSVKAQSFSDFEVLLVNDGSNDSSGIICDKFANEDTRFKVIHKRNGGASSARNRGLSEALGRWIVFMDSDDEIGPDYLKILYENRLEKGLTVAGFYENINGDVKLSIDFNKGNKTPSDICIIEAASDKNFLYHPSPIARIFDGNIIRENSIRFNEKIHLCEDLLFWSDYIYYINRIKILPPISYIYLKDNSTLTKRGNSYISAITLFNEFTSSIDRFYQINRINIPDNILSYQAVLLMNSISALYSQDISKKKRLEQLNKLSKKYGLYIKQHYKPYTILLKLKKWLLINHPRIFDTIHNIH